MNAQATTPEKKPRKRFKPLSLERKQSLYGYIFTLPIIFGLAVIYIPVLIQSFIYSVSEIKTVKGGFDTKYIGFDNYYNALFVDEGFFRTVVESVIGLIPQIFIIIIFAFFMANVLNQNFRGRTVARVIFFIPVVLSTGIIAYFDNLSSMLDVYSSSDKMEMSGGVGEMFNMQEIMMAIENVILNTLGSISTELVDIVMGAINGLYTVITSSGVQMLIFLAGLQGISISMYESAKVEGATGWEVFWKISFPMISPLILVNLVYTVIDLFLKENNNAIRYINTVMGDASRYAEASALSWIYTLVILLFVGIVFLLVQKLVVYQD